MRKTCARASHWARGEVFFRIAQVIGHKMCVVDVCVCVCVCVIIIKACHNNNDDEDNEKGNHNITDPNNNI